MKKKEEEDEEKRIRRRYHDVMGLEKLYSGKGACMLALHTADHLV